MAGEGTITLTEENRSSLDYSRINYLLNPKEFKDVRVTVVGLGSGGAPAVDHLTMNGVRIWELYDPDTLDSVNLVKHPRMRKDLGRTKVEIQKEWILDRNPQAIVETYVEDVILSENFIDSVRRSDLVLCCPDKKSVREFVNDQCVSQQVPFVTASVFRTGIGGEVYAYIPDRTGCYRCLQLFSLVNEFNLSDDSLGLTSEEEERIYGLGEKDFHASGLSIDIQTIALIQARMALSVILPNSCTSLPKVKGNWIIFGNRPAKHIFRYHLEVKEMLLKPQKTCNCQRKDPAEGD